MSYVVFGFLVCDICKWFTTVWGGTIGTICAYIYWIGVFIILHGIDILKRNKRKESED